MWSQSAPKRRAKVNLDGKRGLVLMRGRGLPPSSEGGDLLLLRIFHSHCWSDELERMDGVDGSLLPV